jgi:hypothetical protein
LGLVASRFFGTAISAVRAEPPKMEINLGDPMFAHAKRKRRGGGGSSRWR